MSDERAKRGGVHEIVSQGHRQLDALFDEVLAAFAERREDPDAVRDAFAALIEQLDVHFQQEDLLYYTSIEALRPELSREIRAISEAHRGFRLESAAIKEELERGKVSLPRGRVAAFAEAFRRHETLEESLLERIEAEAPRAPSRLG
jgi:hypothetical protein